MLFLSEEKIKELLPLADISKVIERVEKAFLNYGKGDVQMPTKNYLYFKEYNGDLRVMPAYSKELVMAATKIVNVHPQNPQRGLPTVMAVIILNDAKTGVPMAFMGGTYITGMRTGAAGAVAVKYLARKEARTLGVIGAGEQALFQIAAITKVRDIHDIFVYDINPEKIEGLAKKLEENLGINIKTAPSIEKAVKTDILVTVTPSREPIVKKEYVLPGTHINAIGADAEGKEELESGILKRAKIVIDEWSQASHSGEINVPLRQGVIKKDDIYGFLSEVVIGEKSGRENDEEITIFDSTGLALQDLFTANLVFQRIKK